MVDTCESQINGMNVWTGIDQFYYDVAGFIVLRGSGDNFRHRTRRHGMDQFTIKKAADDGPV
jgi:hypothetical protein